MATAVAVDVLLLVVVVRAVVVIVPWMFAAFRYECYLIWPKFSRRQKYPTANRRLCISIACKHFRSAGIVNRTEKNHPKQAHQTKTHISYAQIAYSEHFVQSSDFVAVRLQI